jgi:hypothetical protein
MAESILNQLSFPEAVCLAALKAVEGGANG